MYAVLRNFLTKIPKCLRHFSKLHTFSKILKMINKSYSRQSKYFTRGSCIVNSVNFADIFKTHEDAVASARADFVGRRTPNKRQNALASPTLFFRDAFFPNSCYARTSFILFIMPNFKIAPYNLDWAT